MKDRTILGIPVESIVQPLAAQLANMGSDVQKLFFKVFANELIHACGTDWNMRSQCCHIAMELTDKEKEVYSQIGFKE